MLPNHALSLTVESAAFVAPKTSAVKPALHDFCQGPIAIGDSSQGLLYQVWEVSTDGANNVIFTPQTTGSPTTVYVGTDVINWVAGTFDQSGRAQVAFMIDSSAYFYWYDSTISAYTLTPLGTDDFNPYICLDDPRPSQSSTSDVILCYTNNTTNHLYFRAQRDRFGVEYDLGFIGAGTLMTQAGPNIVGRFQFQFQSLLAAQNLKFTKFVASRTFRPILVTDAKGIKPRIWKPRENNTVR